MTTAPLRGDGAGNYRILLVGNSGSGKTTMMHRLARTLGCPSLALDHALWLPGWVKRERADIRAIVAAFVDAHAAGSWVIDGNGMSSVGDITLGTATDIVWLDPPLALYLPRLLWRTFLRLIGRGEPSAPGCKETLRMVFNTDPDESIVVWCITAHARVRARYAERMAQDADPRWRRLGGWGGPVRRWLREVDALAARRAL